MDLTLDDLVANRTMSPEIAATLRDTARQRRSFVVMAIPRFAGKTTVMRAMLAHAPAGAPIRTLGADGMAVVALQRAARGGYLVVPEISRHAVVPGYVWGAPVRHAFRGIADGTALATALHAAGVEEAFAFICRENAVPDEDAAGLAIVVYLRSIGPDPQFPTRRAVDSVVAIEGVSAGQPRVRLLHRWNEPADRFETLAKS